MALDLYRGLDLGHSEQLDANRSHDLGELERVLRRSEAGRYLPRPGGPPSARLPGPLRVLGRPTMGNEYRRPEGVNDGR
jgi:hypothetical protein